LPQKMACGSKVLNILSIRTLREKIRCILSGDKISWRAEKKQSR